MTNSGDFRRYSYSNDASYALKAFNVQRDNTAPALDPSSKRYGLKVHEQEVKVKSIAQRRAEQKSATNMSIKIVAVTCLLFAILSAFMFTYVQKNELTREVENISSQIDIANSQNTKLNSELNNLVSMSQIDKYAVEQLGMVKLQSNQVRYIDVSSYKEQRQKEIKKESPASVAKQVK